MKDYIIFLLLRRIPQGTAITIFGIGSRPLTKDTVLTIEDNEVQDIIHSLNEDPTKAKQEIVDQVNNIYGNEKLTFFSLQGIQEYFETIHLECQEISFNRGGTVIQKQGIPEL